MISAKHHLEPKPAEIMQRATEVTAEDFYQLVRPCEWRIFLAALDILGNYTDAEDVAQEAVLKAFEHISSFYDQRSTYEAEERSPQPVPLPG